MSTDMLIVFAHCEHLVDVEYAYSDVAHPLHPSLEEHDDELVVVWPYFQRIQSFRCTGYTAGTMLTAHFPARELSLTTLFLSNLSSDYGKESPFHIVNFLRWCPHLTDLTISDCPIMLPLQSLMNAIYDLKQLERLHFSYLCWSNEQAPGLMLATPSESLQTVCLSAPRLDASYLDALLRVTGMHVRNLTLSTETFFSCRSSTIWMDVSKQVPHLHSLTIDYPQSSGINAELAETSRAEVLRVLGHLPRLVVNSWEEWSPCGQHKGKKQLMLDISN